MDAARRLSCSTAYRRAPPSGHHCFRSSVISGCSPWTFPPAGLSDPVALRRGQVREHARALIEDILDALGLDQVPVIGHSLGGMFALWHVAAGSGRICEVVAIGEPAVAPRAYACACHCRC